MQRIFGGILSALAIAGAILTSPARGAAQTSSSAPALELSVNYQATLSNVVGGSRVWMQGGSAQIHGRFYRGFGMVADLGGAHASGIDAAGTGLSLVTATFGPRYTWSPERSRYSVFAQGLVGEAFGLDSIFPGAAGARSSADSLAVKTGGGVTLNLRPRLALRLLEINYLRTQLPNSTDDAQNNLCLGAGIVFRIK